jgi:hypothetical protein
MLGGAMFLLAALLLRWALAGLPAVKEASPR